MVKKTLLYLTLFGLTASFGDYVNFNSIVNKPFQYFSNKNKIVEIVETNPILKLNPSNESYDFNSLELKAKKINDEEYFVYLEYKREKNGNNEVLELPVYRGTIGPQVGSLEYIFNNFSHKDKISFLEFYVQNSPEIVKKIVDDIWNNKEDIYFDVKKKLFDYFKSFDEDNNENTN